jgi:sterol desaturase/sphingolipid hydroxylase (fatty acid hydroxylase superfamily)
MHFRNFRWRYFQYVRRRHLYHHSRLGVGTAYGITSDFWDKVFGTRIPAPQRDRLLPPATRSPSPLSA